MIGGIGIGLACGAFLYGASTGDTGTMLLAVALLCFGIELANTNKRLP